MDTFNAYKELIASLDSLAEDLLAEIAEHEKDGVDLDIRDDLTYQAAEICQTVIYYNQAWEALFLFRSHNYDAYNWAEDMAAEHCAVTGQDDHLDQRVTITTLFLVSNYLRERVEDLENQRIAEEEA